MSVFKAARVTTFQASKASRWWYRIVKTERRRAGTEKKFRMAEWIDANRCRLSGERYPCIALSRFRNGK